MSNQKHSRARTFLGFLVSAVLVLAALWVFFNRQYISDQVRVWQYHPSQAIDGIGQRVHFTDEGKFVFYATLPEVSDQEHFNSQCPRRETTSPVLGCYTSQDRIFIYNVANDELDGIKEVTAAHEMLHAVWYRMSDVDRDRLGRQLQSAYDSMDDSALKQRMAYYQRNEPTEFLNELHSILGTEVGSLSTELEAHYKRFFTNRQAVVALHQKYNEAFAKLYGRVGEIKPELASLSEQITKKVEQYRQNEATLSRDVTTFNQRATSGGFETPEQFRNERSVLISRANKLDTDREEINQLIAQYNALATEYNTLAKKIDGLNQSIDSYKTIEKGPSVQ